MHLATTSSYVWPPGWLAARAGGGINHWASHGVLTTSSDLQGQRAETANRQRHLAAIWTMCKTSSKDFG